MKKKIYNLLNKNIKEFNRPALFTMCFLYLVVVSLISYCVSTGSFAFFSFDVNGSKTVTGTYAATPAYVFAYHEEPHYAGQPISGGEKTGYCVIDTNTTSCISRLYATLSDCNTANSGATCEPRTVNYLRTDYTYNFAQLNKDFFLKHHVNSSFEITSSDVCYIMNNNLRCLLGGDSMQYTTNKETLQNSFGSSNCTNNTTSYECTLSELTAVIYSNGKVDVHDTTATCDVTEGGISKCVEAQAGS